jgi:NADH-quinone oxidoreductase subunit G
VVDICPVGALTSTRFRFAERVWYLDKKPSICTGCDNGCNITMEHRRGDIKRYKPRFNPDVNDYWMCDYGRASFERYQELPRLVSPRLVREGHAGHATWDEALDFLHHRLRGRGEGAVVFLGSGSLTTEEAYLLARVAGIVGSPHRSVWSEPIRPIHIPNTHGGITSSDASPNRRGAELAGLAGGEDAIDGPRLLRDGADGVGVLVVADSDFGPAAHDPDTVARLRRAAVLVVLGWADTPLARAADLSLPIAHHGEKEGTFVNVQHRLQRFRQAFPAPGDVRSGVDALSGLLRRLDQGWQASTAAEVFALLAAEVPVFAGLTFARIPPTGVPLPGVEVTVPG